MNDPFAHCGYCGTVFAPDQPVYTRVCSSCGRTSYRNPLPVAVLLVPVYDEANPQQGQGLVVIRRRIPPQEGLLALPGGFINYGESWQIAAARELFEETGIQVEPNDIHAELVLSAPDSTILIFGMSLAVSVQEVSQAHTSSETSEVSIIWDPEDLAFPLHETVVNHFFEEYRKF
jgi:ADP-ribose pyrophosphatase YjhB (NUDIX family)